MRNIILRFAAGIALMLTITAASAAVYGPRQQLPAETISDFKADPSKLLQQFPGGSLLTNRVRDLGASDPTTLPMLIALLKSSDQKSQMPAIAAGLAQLARLAARSDQAFASEVQQAVAASGNVDAILAYQAAAGDTAIAATGGGAGGGGTGTGGPTGTTGTGGNGGGSAETFGALHYTTPTTTGGSTGFGGATTGAGSSVSATQ